MDLVTGANADDQDSWSWCFYDRGCGACWPLNRGQRSSLSTFNLVKQAITNSCIDLLKSFR